MSKNRLFIIVIVVIVIAAGAWLSNYFALFKSNNIAHVISNTIRKTAIGYKIEEVTGNLLTPWSIVFTSPDRILISERAGAIRVIKNGELVGAPLVVFPEAATSKNGEEGLMGLAIAPSYPQTRQVFACIAYQTQNGLKDRVIRFEDRETEIANMEVIFDDIPAAEYHAGCRLWIDQNEKLFISTGDSTNKDLAQDKNSKAGKILRINPDGSIPSDNPFPKSPIWSFGHRNPQGLAWDNMHNVLWSSEHGPSVFDGPAGGDEINIIEKGANYGWPLVSHDKTLEGTQSPVITFTPALAPGSLAYYNNDLLPFFKNSLFFGGLAGEGLYRLVLSDDIHAKPKIEQIKEVNYGRIREVVVSPDGFIYFTTSNTDGRGKPRPGDDHLYKIVPTY